MLVSTEAKHKLSMNTSYPWGKKKKKKVFTVGVAEGFLAFYSMRVR